MRIVRTVIHKQNFLFQSGKHRIKPVKRKSNEKKVTILKKVYHPYFFSELLLKQSGNADSAFPDLYRKIMY
ncbi:MAG TPA: hypothetical protein DCF42_08080 [Lachnospiraceae bacterium]|nr:hypothetical protein [Lachnospiraceae bacterium]